MSDEKNLTATEQQMVDFITAKTGSDSVSFADEEGGSVTYLSSKAENTEVESEAVDSGVQEALPKDARWHRRKARRLLVGKSGLSKEAKIERMERAMKHLSEAVHMMKTGEVE